MHDYDWLHQQNQQAWKAKIRQMRSELVEEQTKIQPPHSTHLELAPTSSSEQQHNSVLTAKTSASSHQPSGVNNRIVLPKRNYSDIRKNETHQL
jgi:hypothetical protein